MTSPSTSRLLVPLILTLALCLAGCPERKGAQEAGKVSFTPSGKVQEEEWLGAYFEGKKIGHVHFMAEEGEIDGAPALRVTSLAAVEMSVEGEKSRTELRQTGHLDGKGGLLSFTYDQEILGHRMKVHGTRVKDELRVTVEAGDRRTRVFPWSENLYTTGLLKYALLKRDLAPGLEVKFDVLLEPLLSVQPLTIRVLDRKKGFVGGEEVDIYTLEERFEGFSGTLSMTAGGTTLEETSPNGFRLLRVTKEEALAEAAPLAITDLLLASRIELPRPLENPRGLKTLTLKLKNVPRDFPLIEDGFQKVIKVEGEGERVDYTVRIDSRGGEKDLPLPLDRSGFALYLGSDHVINADNPLIVAEAKRIVGGEQSALKAARRLYEWVNGNIEKRLIDTVSAVDTLKSREGECQAHAHLFAALARAAGLPAKVISGIVYSEEFGGFMYHAWNEVYTGAWIALDPTLGGFPADATHLKLAEGGVAEQLRIMALVGKVRIEVVD